MRIHLDPRGLRQRRDMAHAGDAAAGPDIRLRDIHRAGAEQRVEAVEAMLVLAAGYRHGQAAAKMGIAFQIFRHHRFLKPAKPHIGHRLAKIDCLGAAIGMVGIDHQGDAASPHRRMDGVHHLDIVLDTETDFHLHEAEAAFAMHVRFLDKPRRLSLARDAVEPGGIGFDLTPEGPAK